MSGTATYRQTKGVDHWLTLKDVCEIMGVSRWTVAKWIREGDLPMIKVGGEYRITKRSFERAERAIFSKR